jgi:hypothetical protein
MSFPFCVCDVSDTGIVEYHEWMESEELRENTAIKRLRLGEKYNMQSKCASYPLWNIEKEPLMKFHAPVECNLA